MAGPSEVSGVVPGVVPGPRGPDLSGVADSFSRMAMFMVQMNEQKKVHAAQDLDRMLNMVQGGFPIDPSAIVKAAKKAGTPIMKPEDMKAAVTPPSPTQTAGQGVAKTGAGATGQPGPAQAVQGITKGQDNLQQFKNNALQFWYDNAMNMAQKKGVRDQALMEYSTKVADLKNRAVDGDNVAMGRLMNLNEIPFKIDQAMWNAMSDKQKTGMMDVAAGRETEKEFNARKDALAESLITSGKISDPELAQRAGDALAHGNPLPPDVRAGMKPFTFKDLTQEAALSNQLIELGVPPEKIASVSQAAMLGGLQNALPTGLKPLALQTIQIHQKELEVQAGRLGVEAYEAKTGRERMVAEEAHWQAMASKLDAEAQTAKQKAAYEQFLSLVQLKKSGAKIDDAIYNAAQSKLGEAFGVEAKETNNFFHWLTGGTHLEFTPKPATDVANQFAGAKPKNQQQTPGMVDTFKRMMKTLTKQTPQDQETAQ